MIPEVQHDPREMTCHGLPMEPSRALIVKFEALRDPGHAGDSVAR